MPGTSPRALLRGVLVPAVTAALVAGLSFAAAAPSSAAPAGAASAVLPATSAPATSAPATSDPATTAPTAGARAVRTADLCNEHPAAGRFACFAQRRTDLAVTPRSRLSASAATAPQGYGPADLQSAYALAGAASARGADRTVYVVDAFDDPTAERDLQVYRAQYGLPVCSTANGCFRKLNQDGATSPLPAPDAGWAGEIALDLAMVSAVCPQCRITLIEADDNGDNLFAAVHEATALGAKFVSLSWGGDEFAGEAAYDSRYFAGTGVVYTVASGDDAYAAGVSYPAASPRVVAVGGTRLVRSSTQRGWTESVWNSVTGGAGSGCSAYEPKPAWQIGIPTSTCARRASADVSAVADPATGVAVYLSYGQKTAGWGVFGGTSASAPIIAATYALAGPPAADSHPNAMPYVVPGDVNDVTSGSNGSCAATALCHAGLGWDGPTGMGTPEGVNAFTSADDPAPGVQLTNPGALAGNVGRAVKVAVHAWDTGFRALTYRADGLPTGLSVDASTGVLTGTPTRTGRYAATVTATDSGGATASVQFTWTVSAACTGNVLTNPGFESGSAGWSMTPPRIYRSSTARTGSHLVRLNGRGRTGTDRLSHKVTIPTGCRATLRYYLRVISSDTGTTAHDTLTLSVNGATRQVYSNRNRSTHYVQRSSTLTGYAGRTVTLTWTGRENASKATSFLLDDITLTLS